MSRRTERLNLCLRVEDRRILGEIADREDRSLGEMASLLVEWALEQYCVATTYVRLRASYAVVDEGREEENLRAMREIAIKEAQERVAVRSHAEELTQNESIPRLGKKKQRATA